MRTVGKLVVYGASGVCRIEDIREESFSGSPRCYYILRPLTEQGNSRIFIPADKEKLVGEMRTLLQPEEIYKTVEQTEPFSLSTEWPQDGRMRSKLCRDILASGDREQLIRVVKTVFGARKSPSAAEESAAHRAAIMLYYEFSLSLQLEKADVIPFVLGKAKPAPKE